MRSSRGHFVKASGLRWLCVMLLAPVPWAGCVWGLPFLTVLAPSERSARRRGRRHKTLTDWARQALLQVARWLPGRRIVAVADSTWDALGGDTLLSQWFAGSSCIRPARSLVTVVGCADRER